MVYKRVSKIIFAAILAVTVFSGCGNRQEEGIDKTETETTTQKSTQDSTQDVTQEVEEETKYPSITSDGKQLAGNGKLIARLHRGDATKQTIKYLPFEELTGKINKVETEQSGPLRAVVKISGVYETHTGSDKWHSPPRAGSAGQSPRSSRRAASRWRWRHARRPVAEDHALPGLG